MLILEISLFNALESQSMFYKKLSSKFDILNVSILAIDLLCNTFGAMQLSDVGTALEELGIARNAARNVFLDIDQVRCRF